MLRSSLPLLGVSWLIAGLLVVGCAQTPPAEPEPEAEIASLPPAPEPRAPEPGAPPPDGRLIAPYGEYPWSAIGRLNIAGRGFCTAVLVSTRHILVRASCLYYGNRAWSVADLHFVAGYRGDRFLAASPLTGYVIDPAYDPAAGATLANLTRDWALAELAKPLGDVAGWLKVAWPAGNPAELLAGYRRDWQHALSLFYGCQGACRPFASEQGFPAFIFEAGEMSVSGRRFFPSRQAFASATRDLGPMQGRPPERGAARPAPSKTIAELLWQLGFLAQGPADSDPETLAAAIEVYQAARGQPADGLASMALLEDLLRESARIAATGQPVS